MKVIETELKDVLVVELDVYNDNRGYFLESWSRKRYMDYGIPVDFVQDNVSYSQKHVLRGLHFQNPVPQGKLVTVLLGEVLDVVVDIRIGSPDFGKWTSVVLSKDNRRQLYAPEGFAHGFLVMSDDALVNYKCTGDYHKQAEHGIHWNDPNLAIEWPTDSPIVSSKDSVLPFLNDISEEHMFQYETTRS